MFEKLPSITSTKCRTQLERTDIVDGFAAETEPSNGTEGGAR